MAGRRPKPSWLKAVEGTQRRDRDNRLEPTPDIELPDPPEWLSDAARAHFVRVARRLFDLGAITALDEDILAVYSDHYVGIATRRQKGQKVLASELAQLRALAAELGLGPASRTRIKVQKTPDLFAGDEFAELDAV